LKWWNYIFHAYKINKSGLKKCHSNVKNKNKNWPPSNKKLLKLSQFKKLWFFNKIPSLFIIFFHLTLKFSTFCIDFFGQSNIECYLQGDLSILSTKNIGDNYEISYLTIFIIAKFLISGRCKLFKIYKTSHLTMLLHWHLWRE
jgi:hypothetical protein